MPGVINPSNIPSIQVGGITITNLSTTKTLVGFISGAAAGNSTLRLPGAGAGYAVTVGKTLRVQCIYSQGVATGGQLQFGYADNDVGDATNTAFTNPVRYSSADNKSPVVLIASAKNEIAVIFDIPAGKFPMITNGAAGTVSSVQVFGYEF